MPEFIRGNHDGPCGADDTYTVCRVRVPRDRLVDEIDGHHLHPGYRVLHIRDRHNPDPQKRCRVVAAWPQNTPDTLAFTNINHGSWPACCPAEQHVGEAAREGPPRRLAPAGARTVEYIHGHHDGPGGHNDHYTICRLGMPRRLLIWEVDEGLHPEYRVVCKAGEPHVERGDGTEPSWRCGMVCPHR